MGLESSPPGDEGKFQSVSFGSRCFSFGPTLSKIIPKDIQVSLIRCSKLVTHIQLSKGTHNYPCTGGTFSNYRTRPTAKYSNLPNFKNNYHKLQISSFLNCSYKISTIRFNYTKSKSHQCHLLRLKTACVSPKSIFRNSDFSTSLSSNLTRNMLIIILSI